LLSASASLQMLYNLGLCEGCPHPPGEPTGDL
jgi:hypothetical protein